MFSGFSENPYFLPKEDHIEAAKRHISDENNIKLLKREAFRLITEANAKRARLIELSAHGKDFASTATRWHRAFFDKALPKTFKPCIDLLSCRTFFSSDEEFNTWRGDMNCSNFIAEFISEMLTAFIAFPIYMLLKLLFFLVMVPTGVFLDTFVNGKWKERIDWTNRTLDENPDLDSGAIDSEIKSELLKLASQIFALTTGKIACEIVDFYIAVDSSDGYTTTYYDDFIISFTRNDMDLFVGVNRV